MIKNTRLSNGIEIPAIGLGTFNISDQNELESAIKTYSDAGTVTKSGLLPHAWDKL